MSQDKPRDDTPAQAVPEPADVNPMSGLPPEERMRRFLAGDLQLSDVFEIRNEELYEISSYGRTLYENGRFKDAEKVFEGLTALSPYDANFHVGLALVYQRTQRLEAAMVEYDRAVALNNFDVPAHALRAEAALELGNLEKAAESIQRVTELDPKGESGHAQRAMAMAIAVAKMAENLRDTEA